MRDLDIARLVEGTADAAFVVDGQGLVTAWNDAAHTLFGLTSDQVVGRSCASVVRGSDECGAVCADNCSLRQAAARHRPAANFDIIVPTVDGPQWCNVSVLIVDAAGGMGPHLVHILRAVDLGKRLEMAVRDFVVTKTSLPAEQALTLITGRPTAAHNAVLSQREIEVLGLLARGSSTRGVASELHISRTTVNNHVQHILRKLNAHTRLEAIHRAERAGLV